MMFRYLLLHVIKRVAHFYDFLIKDSNHPASVAGVGLECKVRQACPCLLDWQCRDSDCAAFHRLNVQIISVE